MGLTTAGSGFYSRQKQRASETALVLTQPPLLWVPAALITLNKVAVTCSRSHTSTCAEVKNVSVTLYPVRYLYCLVPGLRQLPAEEV
jgi:hypothetical protein